jgi:hypothetical protein
MFDIDRHLDARQSRRMAAEHRYLTRMERRESDAERMIGELCRNGRAVFYIMPAGGRYREGTFSELVAFLIRNRYA